MNTPKRVLESSFNSTVFIFEMISVFLLVFFVLVWKLIAIALKKQENKVFLSVGFVLATFIAIILPIGLSTIGSRTPVHLMSNPLIVIFNVFLLGYGASGQTPLEKGLIGKPVVKGIPFLLGAHLLGGLLGLIFFYMFFCMFRFLNNKKLKEENEEKQLTFLSLFENKNELSIGKYAIKETFFISLLMILFPFVGMINTAIYSSNNFQIHLAQLIVIGVIVLMSSFFNFFSFHLIFPIIDLIIKTINYLKLSKNNKKIQTKSYLIEWGKIGISIALTIIIPIIIAFISIGIKIRTKGVISLS